MTACLIEHFSPLDDPRIDRKKFHKLIDIIVLSVSAIASGADGWEVIEEFGKEKPDWLRKFVLLENRAPSHDSIAYVLSRVSPHQFRKCFMSWTQAVMEEVDGEMRGIWPGSENMIIQIASWPAFLITMIFASIAFVRAVISGLGILELFVAGCRDCYLCRLSGAAVLDNGCSGFLSVCI